MTKQTINVTAIREANESVKGTDDYIKYQLETYTKLDGKWLFVGYSVPHFELATIKTVKDNMYLICIKGDTQYRYVVNEAVRELLNI